MRCPLPMALLAGGLLAATLALAADVPPSRPEPIVSMRQRMLTPERYQELRQAWKAYTVAHPNDAVGWTQLARASRYSGVDCDEYVRYAEKAVRLAPDDAEACATLGEYRWRMRCPSQPADPAESARLLERALELDPRLDVPHYSLWVIRLSQGRRAEADAHLSALLDGGRMPEPLVDLGYNLLVGLEPDAILITNGDNDTYPPLALQAARHLRADVAVVNLSLLNLAWYRRQLREGPLAVPVPALDAPDDGMQSPAAVKGLVQELAQAGWKRPLYVAVTVPQVASLIPNRLSLEGVVYRVLPATGGDPQVDRVRLQGNLERVYRLQSATSVAIDWEAWSSLRQLVLNYTAAGWQLARQMLSDGDVEAARARMAAALAVPEFHHQTREAAGFVQAWANLDPEAPGLAHWRQVFK